MAYNIDWLTKDAFIWKELTKWLLTLVTSAFLIWLGRTVLFRRDRRIQELDRSRAMFDELRHEFVEIINEYYKVRKRYETMREAITHGRKERSPYIIKMKDKQAEAFDSLILTCIGLEAKYYTLMERLKISFSDLWIKHLASLMEREDRTDPQKPKNNSALEFYLDRIRDRIEEEKDIESEIKNRMEQRSREILAKFNEYEAELLVLARAVTTQHTNGIHRFRKWFAG